MTTVSSAVLDVSTAQAAALSFDVSVMVGAIAMTTSWLGSLTLLSRFITELDGAYTLEQRKVLIQSSVCPTPIVNIGPCRVAGFNMWSTDATACRLVWGDEREALGCFARWNSPDGACISGRLRGG